MHIPFISRTPAAPGERYKTVIPEVHANPFSRLTFGWIFPILKAGFTRPLQIEDIWHLDEKRLAKQLGDTLEKEFFSRCPPEARPIHMGGVRRESSDGAESAENEKREPASTTNTSGAASLHEKIDGPSEIAEQEAEMAAITELQSQVQGEIMSVDMPMIDRIMSLGANAQLPGHKEHVANNESGKKPALPKSINPYTNWRRNRLLAKGKIVVGLDGKVYDQSLTKALFATFWWYLVSAAVCQLLSGALQTTSSLVTKALISYITTAHAYATASATEQAAMTPPRSAGYGIGIAFALALMNEAASIFSNHFFVQAMGAGWMMRAALIDQISRKSLRLSGKARLEATNGRLTTLVSGDCSFLDFASPMSVEIVTQPVTILVGMGLLLGTLGYSALVGLAVLVGSIPLLGVLFSQMIGSRQAQMKLVDSRVRLLSEIMNSIRSIKLYAYEAYFGERVSEFRSKELARLRRNMLHRGVLIALMTFMPVLAATLTFITYGLSGHELNAAKIFSGLQLFNIIAGPLRILPFAFAAVTDAHVANGRIGKLLTSEELPGDLHVDSEADVAIRIHGDFTFESSKPPDNSKGTVGRDRKANKEKKKKKKEMKLRAKQGLAMEDLNKAEEDAPFKLRGLDISIPRGALVVVVGRIGTGKSALLQALIGEMRPLDGEVKFGGSLSYFAQQPWIQNSSLRDNIVFGESADEVDNAKLQRTIDACALERDINILGDALDTEIGERGINLSGGQKARVALARCVYFDSDIVLLDDPLAAVDSHVSHELLEKCIFGALKDKTRVLVTHHLEVLPQADYVILMDDGAVAQQGTYEELRQTAGLFNTLMEEYGSEDRELPAESKEATSDPKESKKQADEKKDGAFKLMQDEERETGSVSWSVYLEYFQSMMTGGWLYFVAVGLILTQVAQVGQTLFLGFWSAQEINGFSQGDYMAVYAGIGVGQAVFTFVGSYAIALAGLKTSFILFNRCLKGVMRSPVLFHDTTPIGRIISRLSKDVEMIDDRLSFQWFQLLTNALSVVGTVGLVFYSYAYLGIIFVPMFVLYYIFAAYYRASSREVKRIDSNTRSFIYSSFGEQLTGMATIRAFRQQGRFVSKLQKAVDKECSVYYMTIVLQRWLGLRLDLLGNILVLGIGVFGVAFRETVSPTKLGVVLTYSLAATQVFSQLVNFFAQVEQEMNNVERVTAWGKLPIEAPPFLDTDPPKGWPQEGHIVFDNVKLRYREGLPFVLKGLTFDVKPGEKIGIIGRTGAGKSSMAVALFRLVELSEGSITIDGVDCRSVGLDTLRTRLSAIPQEALLYGGTIRDNLDPTGVMTDFELNEALRRCGLLLPPGAPADEVARYEKFKLEAVVTDDGGNFSGGERQLVALARAVVKNSKVILLDEATSSVDAQTDGMIQKTIRSEFGDVTLLSIAHRLQTIAFYDRILVLDFGEIAEFAPPLELFDTPGSIFRGMCDAAHLTREQIVRIRANETPMPTRPTTPMPAGPSIK